MFQRAFMWVRENERRLSAFAVLTGFIVDSIFFKRVDLVETHLAFAGYTTICFVTIPIAHWIESRVAQGSIRPRIAFLFPLLTQFALGGFWSALIIFYGRSADFGASWPFLAVLALMLIGNEYFQKYHSRLVFTITLFFFALYSYAIFAIPVYTGTLGTITFLLSGGVAIIAFALFIGLLRFIARDRFLSFVWSVRFWAAVVVIIINVFYFTNILPPLPLAMKDAGVYHSVTRVSGEYRAQAEQESWQVRYLGFEPTLHIKVFQSLSAYSSIFAPTALKTTIMHRWEWYDPFTKKWRTQSSISYSVVGGRDGGYRGYTTLPITEEGKWRVSVETKDGRRIARIPFTVVYVLAEPSTTDFFTLE